MKANPKPKHYSRDDVRRLIREYRPSYRLKDGALCYEPEHTAQKAWNEIIETRKPEDIARLENRLASMANTSYLLARGGDWDRRSWRERLRRMPKTLRDAAHDVQWVLDHPGIGGYVFRHLSKLVCPDPAQQAMRCFKAMAEVGTALVAMADLVGNYNRGPHGAARLKDSVAHDTWLFLFGLEVSGGANLKQALLVLEPIYEVIGKKRPTQKSLRDNLQRHQREWINSKERVV